MMKHDARSTRRHTSGVARAVRRSMSVASAMWLGAFATAPVQAQSAEESPTKASCAQAYESAQESRASGQLKETRRRLAFCARPECPSFVQKDCARWLEEVDRELPSVIVSASGLDASEAAQVTVKVDGESVPNGAAGEPITLDPGPHELVVEHPSHDPVRRAIVAQQGVQKRAIEVRFDTEERVQSPSPADTGSDSSSSLRPYAYAAWGVGAVGIGVFAVLGTLGRADEDGLRQDCAGGLTENGVCSRESFDERKAEYEREFLFADIGLLTGIAGIAAGTVLFVLSQGDASTPDAPEAPGDLSFGVYPLRGGAGASLSSSF